MEQSAVDRLANKSPEAAIIDQISRDFHLAPFMARTYFEQMQGYFEQYLNQQRAVGQMTFLAVRASTPPGRALSECERIAITLTLDSADDLEALRQGVGALRRSKIQRLTCEARDQGALLTQEDLARLLCTSRSTIKRDIAQLRAAGLDVPTRGQVKDIGRGVSHKTQIVGDWLAGYTFTQIKQRRWHTVHSIARYCEAFHRVIRLQDRGLDVAEIRRSTGLSERLLGEYLDLYQAVGPDNERVQHLLSEPDAATEQPAEVKRGGLVVMSPRTQQTIRRIKQRSLPELLVHKFLTEYGYDHGPVIARAIVDDILTTIQECYPERVPPQTVVWLAVRRERPGRRKGLDVSDLVPVRLRLVVDEEIQILIDPQHKRERWTYHAFNQARYVRWCHEAYEQGGVLTNLDLSLLSGKSTTAIAQSLRKYEAATGTVVPTRGTVHDMGPGVTHKAEVIRRWLQHESPLRIARALNHSQDSVDRYIAD